MYQPEMTENVHGPRVLGGGPSRSCAGHVRSDRPSTPGDNHAGRGTNQTHTLSVHARSARAARLSKLPPPVHAKRCGPRPRSGSAGLDPSVIPRSFQRTFNGCVTPYVTLHALHATRRPDPFSPSPQSSLCGCRRTPRVTGRERAPATQSAMRLPRNQPCACYAISHVPATQLAMCLLPCARRHSSSRTTAKSLGMRLQRAPLTSWRLWPRGKPRPPRRASPQACRRTSR